MYVLDFFIFTVIILLPYGIVRMITHRKIEIKTAKIITIISSVTTFIILVLYLYLLATNDDSIADKFIKSLVDLIFIGLMSNSTGYNIIKPKSNKEIEDNPNIDISEAEVRERPNKNINIKELYNQYKKDKSVLDRKDIYRLSYDFKNRASKQHTALKYVEKFIISFSGDNTKFNGYLICDEANNIKEFNILNFKEESFDITLRQNDTVYYINCELISQSDNTALQEEIKSDNIEPDKNNKKQPRFKTATIILSITTVLFAIVTLSLSVGLISQNSQKQEYITKNEELKNKYDTLQNEHYNLQTDYEELCHESDKLKAELLVNSFEHNKNKSDEEALYNEAYDDGYENVYNKGYNDGYIIGYTDK